MSSARSFCIYMLFFVQCSIVELTYRLIVFLVRKDRLVPSPIPLTGLAF